MRYDYRLPLVDSGQLEKSVDSVATPNPCGFLSFISRTCVKKNCKAFDFKLRTHVRMTEAEMPPAPSLSAQELDEDVAFKVLNQDNLPIAIVGENILKPFDRDSHKHKPNVIVHPTRRIATNLEENKQKPFAKSSGHISNNNNNNNDRKNISSSYGNLCHNNSSMKLKVDDGQVDVNKFTKTLDWKLKRLQREENKPNKKPSTDTTTSRKPFVTTVRKGQFLEPPPEIATLIGIKVEEQIARKKPKEAKQLYAFASRPRVLSRTPPKSVHQARCDAAAKSQAKLVGSVVGLRNYTEEESCNKSRSTHHHNIEKRSIVLTSHYDQPKWNPNFAYAKLLSRNEMKEETGVSRAAEAKRRAVARKRAKNQQTRTSQLSRALSQILQGKDPEQILKLQELFANKQLSDACTQTEDTEKPPEAAGPPQRPCGDVQTQIYPGDLFDFDKEVQPILEVLVGKTIEQALIEVLEEEELAALKEQQRKFLEFMSAETAENIRLEKEKRLLKQLEEQDGTNLISTA